MPPRLESPLVGRLDGLQPFRAVTDMSVGWVRDEIGLGGCSGDPKAPRMFICLGSCSEGPEAKESLAAARRTEWDWSIMINEGFFPLQRVLTRLYCA